ncbi:amidohydrolase [Bacillus sp. CGMCC 1.16607]|uniref:amidohydrolase n=1 Tax=Bacillus sp. CGMCC 1.16607 TaxID=3351842 RepID=UPI003637BFD3
MNSSYWLTNVRLEKSYQFENELITGTQTENCHLLIENSRIAKIISAETALEDKLEKKDARNLLALPSFKEMHVHLDKTLHGDKWRAVTPAANIFERFEMEKRVLPTLPTTTKERAKALIEILLQSGSTHIRTHVDIYPEVGLNNLYAVQEALLDYEGMLSHEIVAFPQHGLLHSNCQDLVREAVRQGATLVGGVDPANVDGNMEKSLQQMMEIAIEGNVDVDLHLHDPGALGLSTIKRLAKLTEEAGWQGRVTVSHAFALGDMAGKEADDVAQTLSELGISIITSVPIGRTIPPVTFLHEIGVNVAVACDNIFDSWSPFGNGDILERAGRLAELTARSTEYKLAETLGFITGGKTPLDKNGQRVWPQVGDDASMVFVKSSCSAEAIARRSVRPAVLYKGKIVSGNL